MMIRRVVFLSCLIASVTDTAWAACNPTGANQTCVNDTDMIAAPGGDTLQDSGLLTITNNGSLQASAAGNIMTGNSVNITNNGSIIGVDASTYGFWVTNVTMVNNGLFDMEFGANFNATNVTVDNYGSILSGGQTFLIGTGTVRNYGLITGADSTFYASDLTLFNYGTILGSKSNLNNTVQSDTLNLVNYGLISSVVTAGADPGAGILAGAFVHTNQSSVTNYGSISARTDSGNARAVWIWTPGTLTNAGTIAAYTNSGTARAIEFTAAGGVINLLPGSKIIGSILLNGNVTNLNLYGGNNNLTVDSLAGATVSSSSPIAISGARIATLDTSSFAASNAMTNSITRGISVLTAGPNANTPSVITSGGTALWASGFGGHSTSDNSSSLNFSSNYYGGAVGFHHPLASDFMVGGFIGAANGDSNTVLDMNDTDTNIGFIGGYVRKMFGQLFVKAAAQGGISHNETHRRINNNLVAGGIENARANYNGGYVSPELGIGYIQPLGEEGKGKFYLSPSAQLRYTYNQSGSYTETGSTANMSMDSNGSHFLEERLEMKLYHVANFESFSLKSNLTGGAIGQQQIGNKSLDARLLGQPISFTAPGDDNVWGPMGAIGVELSKGNLTFFAGGQYVYLPDASRDVSGKLGINVRF